MKMRKIFSTIFLLAPLVSCGPRDTGSDSRALSTRLPEVRPLIVGMSGYATCKESKQYHDGELGPLAAQIFRKLEPIIQQMTEKLGVEPALLASCFTDDSELIAASSLDGWKPRVTNDGDYISHIHEQMSFFTHTFVVGHSYGGWLSMKLAESYVGPVDKIKTLHTIDPISKKLCYFDNISECLSAPRDIDATAREHIRDVTQLWVNAWQDDTFFLHSSPIAEADLNPEFNAEHWDIDNNDDLWHDIEREIAINL